MVKMMACAYTKSSRKVCRRLATTCLVSLQLGILIFTLLTPVANKKQHFTEFNGWAPDDTYFAKVVDGGWARQLAAWIAFGIYIFFHRATLNLNEHQRCGFVKATLFYMALNWFMNSMQAISWSVAWYLPLGHVTLVPSATVARLSLPSITLAQVFKLLVDFTNCLTNFVFYGLVQHRLELVEEGFGESLGSKVILAVRVFVAVLAAMVLFTLGELNFLHLAEEARFWSIVNACQCISPFLIAAILFRALSRVLKATRAKVPGLRGYVAAEKSWAENNVRRLRWPMTLPLLIDGCLFLLKACLFLQPSIFEYSLVIDAVACINTQLMETICLCFLVGIFKESKPEIETSVKLTRSSRQRSETWQEKTRSLAERSISSSELLAFYEILPELMHFDPKRSTTNDVVRQAIIPLSKRSDPAEGGSSYAEILFSSPRMPEQMVTHNWGNLFADLVAAVLADALGQGEYILIGQLLIEDAAEVKSRLKTSAAEHKLYWICAFCVNQHAGICGGFGAVPEDGEGFQRWDSSRRDTVTGDVYPTCSCNEPKHFSDHPDECEMNKFDDMMDILHSSKNGLRQVVAVDRCMALFTRAWCVAELVQASASHIPQRVQLYSLQEFKLQADVYKRLAFLQVEDCQAANAQDKEEILGKIPDKDRFNMHLQSIIFGANGLFQQQFIGFGTLDAAVRTARRISSLANVDKESQIEVRRTAC